ncbi:DUF6778 family protein [Loktanella agnita]|uniref:DUF6778 family protein n=1 Tax=Loktanella agnita TaxID=287097 RepID=UPI003986C37C
MLKACLYFVALFLSLSACSGPTSEYRASTQAQIVRSYDLRSFSFTVPDDLSVSEIDGYYPIANIVWRGDPRGDRKAQITEMFETAAARNQSVIDGQVPVAVHVQLSRFHGVTDKTRYSVGGVYNIVFLITVRNDQTGEVIEPTRRVAANLDAPGGSRAVELEQSGQTQKVRVTDFLTKVLREELT